MTHAPSLDARAWITLLLLSQLWAGSFLFAKIAVAEIAPLSLVALRVSLASLTLAIAMRALGEAWPRDLAFWRAAFVMGLINNVIPFALLFWAQRRIDAGLAAILNATMPLWTIVLAHALTRDERLQAHRLLGVATGVGGVIVLVGHEALPRAGRHLPEQLAVLGATIAYALGVIWGKRFRGHAPMTAAAAQLACAGFITAPLALLLDAPWARMAPGARSWAAVAGLALLSTALAYVLYFRLIMTTGAGNASLVTMLIAPMALIMAAIAFGETPGPEALAGLALIIVGLVIVDGRVIGR